MYLFWYSFEMLQRKPKYNERRFYTRIFKRVNENYGDLLSKYIVEKISQKKTIWYNSKYNKQNIFVIGSILKHTDKHSVVWGSGIIEKKDVIKANDFRCVRGPLTRKRVLELKRECPEIYGDPAILLPEIYNPRIKKKYKLGIVPHYVDYKFVSDVYGNYEDIKIINLLTQSVKKTTREILECEKIISSSLHGMIVAHSYGIESIWVKFDNILYGDNVKFDDYLLSVNIQPYQIHLQNKTLSPIQLSSLFINKDTLPEKETLLSLKRRLIETIPFECKNKKLLNI